MTNRFNSSEAGAFYISTIVLALSSLQVSFNLGAYGEIFYASLMTLWIASLAASFGALVIGHTIEGEIYVTWWGISPLCLPTVLMTAALWQSTLPWLVDVLEWGVLLSIPYIGYILLSVAAQEATEIQDKRLLLWLLVGFVLLNTLSYLAGANNALFFACDDFLRAGDEAPNNCWSPATN
jgi:hypothetical protein